MCKRLHSSQVFEQLIDEKTGRKVLDAFTDKQGRKTYGPLQAEPPPFSNEEGTLLQRSN